MMKMKSKYTKLIEKTLKKFPREQTGGCMIASDYMISRNKSLKRVMFKVNDRISHVVVVTKEGYIIDTQFFQFGAILEDFEFDKEDYIFTLKEYYEFILIKVKTAKKK
jgi:hypothetical protein